MPLVPLYDETGTDNSSHVRAPGGYECWRLRAYDLKEHFFLQVSLWNGYPFHPRYLKNYRRYLRHPTRIVPPRPEDFACQELILVNKRQVVTQVPPIQSFPTLPNNGLALSIDGCTMHLYPRQQTSALELTTLASSHRWKFARALGSLQGEIQLGDREYSIDALACHEYRFGASPNEADFWLEGIVFFPLLGKVICFEATSTTSWIIEITPETSRIVDQPLSVATPARNQYFLNFPFPRRIDVADRVILTDPDVKYSSPLRSRRFYRAQSPSGNEQGYAYVEISRPRRIPRELSFLWMPRPRTDIAPITWSPLPPADKSSPSDPERARDPFSSP